MRHTGCACTGMPRRDLEMIFEFGGWTAEQRLASMASMVPTTGFGETFQYSNSMVSTGGFERLPEWPQRSATPPDALRRVRAGRRAHGGDKSPTVIRDAPPRGARPA